MKHYTHEELQKLAARIYYLDEQVYMMLGSNLGRVFNIGRVNAIEDMVEKMEEGEGYVLRNELALISNMARTIPNDRVRSQLMREYEKILNEVLELPDSQINVDILDKHRAELLAKSSFTHRFGEHDHFIICIERAYGCGGTGIGFEVADRLHINYYDDEIFDEVLKRLDAEKDYIRDHGGFSYDRDALNKAQYIYADPEEVSFAHEQKKGFFQHLKDFNRYHGLSKRDAVFFNQSELLQNLALEEDFVIMGHCANAILTNNNIPHISIYLTAPFDLRVERVMHGNKNLNLKQARRLVKKQDDTYGKYYEFFTGLDWKDAVNYDISLNTAAYGFQGTVERIVDTLKHYQS